MSNMVHGPIPSRIWKTAELELSNPVLAWGVAVTELTADGGFRQKTGDGVTPWNALPYSGDSDGTIGTAFTVTNPNLGAALPVGFNVPADMRISEFLYRLGAEEAPPLPVAPTITSANSTSAVTGAGGTFQVTATGDAPIRFSLRGAPAGVSISGDTGLITIAPTVPVLTSAFNVTANNGVSPNAEQTFTLTVTESAVAPIFYGVVPGANPTADIILGLSQSPPSFVNFDVTFPTNNNRSCFATPATNPITWISTPPFPDLNMLSTYVQTAVDIEIGGIPVPYTVWTKSTNEGNGSNVQFFIRF
jgi:hypothetical protein